MCSSEELLVKVDSFVSGFAVCTWYGETAPADLFLLGKRPPRRQIFLHRPRRAFLTQATCTRIRFQKDPFWGVHTYRTSIRRPRSHGHGLIQGNVPPPENHGLCVRTRLELKSHFFCLFPLLASVVLLYCFTCLRPVEGVYVVCESWRQVP